MYHLSFPCIDCTELIPLPLSDPSSSFSRIRCEKCEKVYDLSNDLQRQIQKFVTLCQTLKDSEEILGQANVGVDVGPHHVEIPFQLLLTRFGTSIRLQVGQESVVLSFRHEPIRDLSLAQKEPS